MNNPFDLSTTTYDEFLVFSNAGSLYIFMLYSLYVTLLTSTF